MIQDRRLEEMVTDYVLGLLTAEEKRLFEAHTAVDEQLRQAVLAERALFTAVQDTLTAATAPTQRVRDQRPVPRRASRRKQVMVWLKPLAMTALLLFLLLGSLGMGSADPLGPSTAVAATMTATHTTTPASHERSAIATQPAGWSIPASPALIPTRQPIPQPQATPIAHVAPHPNTEG